MRIDRRKDPVSKSSGLSKLLSNRIVSTLLVYNLFLAAVALAGLLVLKPTLLSSLYNQGTTYISNYFSSKITAQPEQFKIDIKQKNFQKIAYQRQVSLDRKSLTEVPDNEVPAKITFEGEQYKVNLRLKGKISDHWDNEETMSLKVKVKGGKRIKGMRNFAFQHPKTRNYLNEWVFQRLANHLDIVNLRYEFASVDINGKGENVYAIEEGLDKLLIENNQRKEGPILEFNTDIYWIMGADLVHRDPSANTHDVLIDQFYGASIDGFQKKSFIENPTLQKHYTTARNLLEAFRKGEKSSSEVFDIDKLATLFAITNLFGNNHSGAITNIRFYYNPISSRIEPIAHDQTVVYNLAYIEGEGLKMNSDRLDGWIPQIYSDPVFFARYLQVLEEISDKQFLDDFFEKIAADFEKNTAILRLIKPTYQFPKEVLYRNQKVIKINLNPKEKVFTYLNYINKETQKIGVSTKNISTLPIEIVSLTINDTITILANNTPFVQASNNRESPEQLLTEFDLTTDLVANDSMQNNLKLNYRFLKNTAIASAAVYPWPNLSNYAKENNLAHAKANVSDFPFLSINKTQKEIRIQPGDYTIDKHLIIPEGYTVIATEGTSINLINKANIFSQSPLKFEGTSTNPIRFVSSDSTGQGLIIMNTKKSSILSHVHFDNLANPKQNNWSLSGAVTFYYAPVKVDNCYFSNNRIGDDLLNLVHSNYTLEHSVFENTNSDALDTDFSNGSINECRFTKIGNDGIDVSGSEVLIKNLTLNQIGDKGISAGENSSINVETAYISNSELAVTSKDKSVINITDVTIENSKVGFTVFQKKPEFGPGFIYANKIQLTEVGLPYLVEKRSGLQIDNKVIPSNRKNVEAVLYGKEFGKSSK